MSAEPTFKISQDGTTMVDTSACRATYDDAAGEVSLLVYGSSLKEGHPLRRFKFPADAMEASRIIGLITIEWGDGAGITNPTVYASLPKDARTRPFAVVEGLEAPMVAEPVKISIARLSQSTIERDSKSDRRMLGELRLSDLKGVHVGIERGDGRPVMLMVTGNRTSDAADSFQSKLAMLPNGSEVLAEAVAWRIRGEWRDLVVVPETALAIRQDDRSRNRGQVADEEMSTLFAESRGQVTCRWRFGTDAAGRDVAIRTSVARDNQRTYAVGAVATALKALASDESVKAFYRRNPGRASSSYIWLKGTYRSTVVNGCPQVEFRAEGVKNIAKDLEAAAKSPAAPPARPAAAAAR